MLIWKILILISWLAIVYGIVMNIKYDFKDITDKYDFFVGGGIVLIFVSLFFLTKTFFNF